MAKWFYSASAINGARKWNTFGEGKFSIYRSSWQPCVCEIPNWEIRVTIRENKNRGGTKEILSQK